jgi:hypothetical protein
VFVTVAVGGVVGEATVAVAVKVGEAVWVAVGGRVFVGVGVTLAVQVRVGKTIETGVRVAVAVARGVRVATFGTQITWPTDRLNWLAGMQLANWSWVRLTPKAWASPVRVFPGRTV